MDENNLIERVIKDSLLARELSSTGVLKQSNWYSNSYTLLLLKAINNINMFNIEQINNINNIYHTYTKL